MLKVNEPKRLF